MDIRTIPLADIVFEAFDDIDGGAPIALAYRNMIRAAETSTLRQKSEYLKAQNELVKTLIRILSSYRLHNPFTTMSIHNIIFFSRLISCLKLSATTEIASADMEYFAPRGPELNAALIRQMRVPKSMFTISDLKAFHPFMQNMKDPAFVNIRLSEVSLALQTDHPLYKELENHNAMERLVEIIGEVGFIVNHTTLRKLGESAALRKLSIISQFEGHLPARPRALSDAERRGLNAVVRKVTDFYSSIGR